MKSEADKFLRKKILRIDDLIKPRPPEKAIFKEREVQRIFEGIEDEIAILTATAKFNFTICKTDKNTLKLTLVYIEDTQKLIELLKNRMNLPRCTSITYKQIV